jgi:hypothetical protein
VAFPTIQFTIGRVMVAIAIVALWLATSQNVVFALLWVFVFGPLCGFWLLRRKGSWAILGGGAGGAVISFLFAIRKYPYEFGGPQEFGIWIVFLGFICFMPFVSGLVFGFFTGVVLLVCRGLPEPTALPDAVGPIDARKWKELFPTSTRTRAKGKQLVASAIGSAADVVEPSMVGNGERSIRPRLGRSPRRGPPD